FFPVRELVENRADVPHGTVVRLVFEVRVQADALALYTVVKERNIFGSESTRRELRPVEAFHQVRFVLAVEVAGGENEAEPIVGAQGRPPRGAGAVRHVLALLVITHATAHVSE